MFLRRQVQLSLHRFDHSEITDPWSEGATEEGKIRDDGSIQMNLTVLDQLANSGWIQDARAQGGRISRPRDIHMV